MKHSVLLALAGTNLPSVAQKAAAALAEKPKLILQITVDQLRGDMPARFLDHMGEGGFRYFLEEGIVWITVIIRRLGSTERSIKSTLSISVFSTKPAARMRAAD